MILPVQHRPHTRQIKEKGLSRRRQKSNVAASAVGGEPGQALLQFAVPEPLDFDDRHLVGLEMLQDPRRKLRGVQKFVALVPLELGLLPLHLKMLGLESLFARLAPVKEAEGRGKGGGCPRELKDFAPADGFRIFLISHALMLIPEGAIVKAGEEPLFFIPGHTTRSVFPSRVQIFPTFPLLLWVFG